MHLNLIVFRVGIHKTELFIARRRVHLVNPWQRKVVFGADLVEIDEVIADSPLVILLHQDQVSEPFEVVRLSDEV